MGGSLQTILFQGRSGSGKGTQASLMVEYLRRSDPDRSTLSFATGARFRELAGGPTHTGSLIKELLAAGELPPEFAAIWIWADFFIREYAGPEHLIFDGFPRREHEAAMLDVAFRFYGRVNPHIIVLDVSRAWAFERLLARGRADDSAGKINRRLDWYESDVLPAIEFFTSHPDYYNVHIINGEQTIEGVHADVRASIAKNI